MTWLDNLLPDNLTYALGWTVVHSLWQGTIIAAVMALILIALKDQKAYVRYWVSIVALLLMFIAASTTFLWLISNSFATTTYELQMAIILRGYDFAQEINNQTFIQSISAFFDRHIGFIVAVWFMGIAFFLLRMIGGLMYIEILKTRHLTPLSNEWVSRMNVFKNRLGIRKTVALMESALIAVPMTIGWLKPLIMMPIGTVNSMTVGQVEAILAHELAHIQSKDYIFNIFQTIIEILFYYHPAVWWMSANIRAERENRCDDMAVDMCGNSLTYAKALLALQEVQHQNIRTYGLAMTFSNQRKGFLLKRIKRILNQPQNRSNIMEKLSATGLLLLVVAVSAFTDKPNNTPSYKEDTSALELPTITIMQDTTPKRKGEISIQKNNNNKSIELKMKDGEITHLRIDGADIPKEKFGDYEADVEDLIETLPPTPPTPPTPPPTPPSFGNMPMPPMPPAPPSMPNFPTPPVPPSPPTPPSPPQFRMKKGKDSQGNTILKFDKGDGKESEMVIKDGKLYMDGKEVEDGKDIAIDIPNTRKMKVFPHSGGTMYKEYPQVWSLDRHMVMPLRGFDDMAITIKPKADSGSKIRIVIPESENFENLKNYPNKFRFDNGMYFLNNDSFPRGYNDLYNSEDFKNLREQSKILREETLENSKKLRAESRKLQEQSQKLSREALKKFRLQNDSLRHLTLHTIDSTNKNIRQFNNELKKELKKDGYFKSMDNTGYLAIEFKDSSLKINGEVMSKNIHEKYLDLYYQYHSKLEKGGFSIYMKIKEE
jgi:beta-lactamase regulating signal transducer with metallopeptidase domain